jgi:hypothetical protein
VLPSPPAASRKSEQAPNTTQVTACTNAISCYFSDSYVRRLYNPPNDHLPPVPGIRKTTSQTTTIEEDFFSTPQPDRRPSVASIAVHEDRSPVTDLSSRTFATWNIAVGLVRLHAAYHIHERDWYHMQMLTNVVGLVHFGAEAFYWRTARPSGPWLAPTVVAMIGMSWSLLQYGHYVK